MFVSVEEGTCFGACFTLGRSFLGLLNYAHALAGGAVSERAPVNGSIHHCHV